MTIKNYVGCRGMAPFPLGETRTSAFTELDKLLGHRYDCGEGVTAILVQANAAMTDCESKCVEWSDSGTFEVVETTTVDKVACGVCHPYQEDVAADGYLLILVGEEGAQLTVIAHASITALDALQPTTAGRCLTDAVIAPLEGTIGYAEEAAADQGDTVLMRCVAGAFSSVAV